MGARKSGGWNRREVGKEERAGLGGGGGYNYDRAEAA